MAYVDIVTALALIQFIVLGLKVGRAREKYGIKAPAVSGNEQFERVFRVQQNTMELLLCLVPGLYLFGRYVNPVQGALLGLVYLVGREVYSASYTKNPAKRGPGFGLSMLPVMILLLGGLVGAALHVFRAN